MSTLPKRSCDVYVCGQVPYGMALDWQRRLVNQRLVNQRLNNPRLNNQRLYGPDLPHLPDTLLLMEHPPVYTLGQGATESFLKFDPARPPAELIRVERGGEVTYHCPGQLVGYPILNLYHYQQDLHWYLRQLEEVLLQTLACYGLKGDRLPGLTGVWLEGYKVAAIGIKVSRWITMHGFALNVCPALQGFEAIVPCGIGDRPVGSLAQWQPDLSVNQIIPTVIQQFGKVFGIEPIPQSQGNRPLPETPQNETQPNPN